MTLHTNLETQKTLTQVFDLARSGRLSYRQALHQSQIPFALKVKILGAIQTMGVEGAYKMALSERLLTSNEKPVETPSISKAVVDRISTAVVAAPLKNTRPQAQAASIKAENTTAAPKLERATYLFDYNPHRSVEDMRKVYATLGKAKWVECVDGIDHSRGPWVYDKGLHGEKPEPGYLKSMSRGFGYILRHLGEKITPEYYLSLHKRTCAHFLGDDNGTLMHHKQAGKFRTGLNRTYWHTKGKYLMTQKALQEFESICPPLGKVTFSEDKKEMVLRYTVMNDYEVEACFKSFFSQYYKELEAAGDDPEARLTAVARVIQNLQRLHCVPDGSGRTDNAILNQLLTEVGFHPVILEYPYFSTSKSLEEWTNYLKIGLLKWEAKAIRLKLYRK